ncbi:MAG: class I SAM-dependent methyltransferase [Gemmatimonadota bacterium]
MSIMVRRLSSQRRIRGDGAHFRHISRRYDALRTFHGSIVDRTVEALEPLGRPITLVDVGVGTGRYLLPIVRQLEQGVPGSVRAVGVDAQLEMLERFAVPATAGCPTPVVADGHQLPLPDGIIGALLCFNAIHHFELRPFCAEAARVLFPGGRLLAYTRTPEQNRRTIWGRLFPLFADKERRLYSAEEIRGALELSGQFRLLEIATLQHAGRSSAERLHEQAQLRHYSTFDLYTPEEFSRALEVFQHRLEAGIDAAGTIEFTDENTWVAAVRL